MLIGINIVNRYKDLLNKNNFPILLYLNECNDLFDFLKNDNQFITYLREVTQVDYITCNLYCFIYNDNNEKYKEHVICAQEFIKFDELDEDTKHNIVIKYIFKYVEELYKEVFPNVIGGFAGKDLKLSYQSYITMMHDYCTEIRNEYEDSNHEINNETIINCVRGKLSKDPDFVFFNDDTKRALFDYVTKIFESWNVS